MRDLQKYVAGLEIPNRRQITSAELQQLVDIVNKDGANGWFDAFVLAYRAGYKSGRRSKEA